MTTSRVDQSRTEQGARIHNKHVQGSTEGGGTPSSTTPALVVITAILPGTFLVGSTLQVTAQIFNAAGVLLAGVIPDGWLSSNVPVATVDGNGLVRGVAVGGPVSITATCSGIVSNAITLSVLAPVVDVTPASIAITPTSVTLVAGQTQQLTAAVKNAGGGTIAGVAPDGWRSADTAVATVSSTGLITAVGAGGPMNVTATLTSPSLTSNACAVTGQAAPPVTDEPIYNPATDSILYQDNFDGYTDLYPACVADVGARFVDTAWNTCALPGNAANPNVSLITGRSGSGKAVRIKYDGVYQESPGLETVGTTNTGRVPVVTEYWARVTAASPFTGAVAIKWIEHWHSPFDPQNTRIEFNTRYPVSGTTAPAATVFQVIDQVETATVGQQPIGPFFDFLVNSGWHHFKHRTQPNSAPGARDGRAEMWIDGAKMIDIRGATIGVTPTGGYKPWCDASDVDGLYSGAYGIGQVRFGGPLTTVPGSSFTLDIDDFIEWLQPDAP